jgi:hypothetical protein
MPVDCHDTNSSPDGRFARIAVKRSGTVRSWPADVTSYTAVPVMIAMQPYVRVFTSLFGVIVRYFVRPERMASMYFALSSVVADEWLYVRSLPNSFSIAAKSFEVCAA